MPELQEASPNNEKKAVEFSLNSGMFKGFGAGATLLGGAFNAYGQYLSSKNQISQNNIQADWLLKQAYLNGVSAQKNIQSLSEAGMEQMSAITDSYLNTESDARVAAAVSNVDITKGSAMEVANASYLGYLKDKDTLSKNIGNQISDIQTQADIDRINAEYQAKSLKLQNKYIRRTRWIGIGGTILGSAAQAAAFMV